MALNLDDDELNHLFRYCVSLTGDRDQARDLLHNAIERYLTGHSSAVAAPKAYLQRTIHNLFVDQHRRDQRFSHEPIDEAEAFGDTERDLENLVVDMSTLERVWQALTAAEREVVFLWACEQMSASEIALYLAQPRATILARLRRLRLKVQKRFSSPALFGKKPL